MRGQPVPDQRELVPAEVVVQVLEEFDERVLVVGPGTHGEHEPGIAAVGCESDSCGYRKALPAEVVMQDRSLAPERPGGPHRGEEGEPALVLEADPGLAASGVFYPEPIFLQLVRIGLVVALDRSPGRALTAPTHLAWYPPDVTWVVGDPGHRLDRLDRLDRLGHTLERPHIGGRAVGQWALCQPALDLAKVCPVELGKTTGSARSADVPPEIHSACQRSTIWRETSSSRSASAWLLPWRNSLAACLCRRSLASKSRVAPDRKLTKARWQRRACWA